MSSVCFITAHPNPANHFVEFAKALEKKGIQYEILAGEDVKDKFKSLAGRVSTFDLKEAHHALFYEKLEKEISNFSVVITDIANENWVTLYQRLQSSHPHILRAVYYDNPESYVPGGYSELAAKVVKEANRVLFANKLHTQNGIEAFPGVPVDLKGKELFRIGYYPQVDAANITQLRQDVGQVEGIKNAFFERKGIENPNSKVITYAGGANDVYYQQAFPHFISTIEQLIEKKPQELENTVFVLQQHPRAEKDGGLDRKQIEHLMERGDLPKGFKCVVSDLSTVQALAISQGVFYYQTSMAAQFVLAGIPLVAQVGHDTFPDLLIKTGFPSVVDAEGLSKVLSTSQGLSSNLKQIKESLGIEEHWDENLLEAVTTSV